MGAELQKIAGAVLALILANSSAQALTYNIDASDTFEAFITGTTSPSDTCGDIVGRNIFTVDLILKSTSVNFPRCSSGYKVHVTVNGTYFSLSFAPFDTSEVLVSWLGR